MIKNIIFDIGNVILNFDIDNVLSQFTNSYEDRQFILENIINSPEWLQFALIDTGFITREEAIKIVKDRTNHVNDTIIEKFWNNYNNYASINCDVINLIKKLKDNNYSIYLLSNINPYTHQFILNNSKLFDIVDGYVLSYQVHKVKPYKAIYEELLNKYNLIPEESLFIDDNQKNILTANELGIYGKSVIPDNYDSVINLLNEFEIL